MDADSLYHDLLIRYRAAAAKRDCSFLRTRQVRDLTLIELIGDLSFVVAIDSDGGIGPKPHDVVQSSGYLCGRFATRVPLMEIVACGAVPVAAFDALAVEMEPLGREIIRGVREELASIGLRADFPLSGSTEDNVPTSQTGIGVMVLGIAEESRFRPGRARQHDTVYCVGVPKSGPRHAVVLGDPEIADVVAVLDAANVKGVHDILPVGSRGVTYEAHQLAASARMGFSVSIECPIDLGASAGPSTCFLVSAEEGIADMLRESTQKPVAIVGRIV